jgi:hypothetical protein
MLIADSLQDLDGIIDCMSYGYVALWLAFAALTAVVVASAAIAAINRDASKQDETKSKNNFNPTH